jgi:heme oxygenase
MDLDRSSGHPCLRSYLRVHTSDLHQRLDAQVGSFSTPSQYCRFVEQSVHFRRLAEPACADFPPWQSMSLIGDMQSDLDDLVSLVPPSQPVPIEIADPAAKLGALYVLEGSSLGARLLIGRANALGFTQDFGARHLARQSGDRERWRSFVDVLDASTFQPAAVLVGAILMFEAALAIYSEELVG